MNDGADPDRELLRAAADAVFAMLHEVGGDPRRLPRPQQEFVIVYSAQGVIDNGGLRYFFASDWPGAMPYAAFVDAYRAIGAGPAADAIAAAAALFDFPEPERQALRRNELMNAALDVLMSLESQMTCDIWTQLIAYVRAHEATLLRRR